MAIYQQAIPQTKDQARLRWGIVCRTSPLIKNGKKLLLYFLQLIGSFWALANDDDDDEVSVATFMRRKREDQNGSDG